MLPDLRPHSAVAQPDTLRRMDAETVIAISFGAILAVFSFSVVYYTFIRARQYGGAKADALTTADDQELADIFDAINTLDLEYQLGRLAEKEFQAQFQAYRVQAAAVLRDQLEAGRGDPAWVLEQEVLVALGGQGNTSGRVIACPDCSAAVLEGTPSCPQCGAEMSLLL